MNLFNNIEKYNYTEQDKKCVSLEEYIIFEDERECEKYMLFKLRNNLIQELHEIRFEICQYDDKGNLVEKNVIQHADFSALPEELFVPNAKLKANYLCKTISFKLIYAKFDTAYYEDEVLHANSFNFERYKEQVTREKKKRMTKKELKELRRQDKIEKKKREREQKINAEFSKIEAKNEFLVKEKKIKSKYLKSSFSITNTSAKSKTVFANVLLVLGIVATIGWTGYSTFKYKNISSLYNDNDFDYQILDDTKVSVYKYYGTNTNVTIPLVSRQKKNTTFTSFFTNLFSSSSTSEYNTRYITKVGDDSFSGSNVSSITFQNQNVEIGARAFQNCKNLKTIYGDNISYIQSNAFDNTGLETFSSTNCKTISEYAFANNSSLKTFYAPNANVDKYALSNCANIETVYIGSTNASTVGEIFGTTNVTLPSTIKDLYVESKTIPSGFFYDLNKSISIHLCDDVSFENPSDKEDMYGESRKFDDSAVTISDEGVLTGISTAVQRLTIPASVNSVASGLVNKTYASLKCVVINSLNFDYNTLIENNPQIEQLVFNVDANMKNGILKNLTGLIRLEFNNGVTFNEVNPLSNNTNLDWLILSNLQDTNLLTVLNNARTSIHYLVIKNMNVSSKYFDGLSVNSLSLIGCNVDSDAFTDATITNIYFGIDCTLGDDVLTNIGSSTSYVLFEGEHNFESKPSYTVINSVRLTTLSLTVTQDSQTYVFSVDMYYFSYLPSNLLQLFNSESSYYSGTPASTRYTYAYESGTNPLMTVNGGNNASYFKLN